MTIAPKPALDTRLSGWRAPAESRYAVLEDAGRNLPIGPGFMRDPQIGQPPPRTFAGLAIDPTHATRQALDSVQPPGETPNWRLVQIPHCIPVGTLSSLFAEPICEQKRTPAARARLTFPQNPETGLRIGLATHETRTHSWAASKR